MATEETVKRGWCNFQMESLGGMKKLAARHISVWPDSQHASGYYGYLYKYFDVISGLIWNTKAEVYFFLTHFLLFQLDLQRQL